MNLLFKMPIQSQLQVQMEHSSNYWILCKLGERLNAERITQWFEFPWKMSGKLSFSVRLEAIDLQPCFSPRITLPRMFPWEFHKSFQNCYYVKHLWTVTLLNTCSTWKKISIFLEKVANLLKSKLLLISKWAISDEL